MVIAQHQNYAWNFGSSTPIQLKENPMSITDKVFITLAEGIPAGTTGLIVWLRGGPVSVAVLAAGGVAFASVAAIEAARHTLVRLAEVYDADHIETEELR